MIKLFSSFNFISSFSQHTHVPTHSVTLPTTYYAIVRKKAFLAHSHSGGIAVLVENSLAPFTSMCDWSNPCCLAIKIKASTLPTDLYVLTVYLPPEHSSYLKSTNTDPFLLQANAFNKIPQDAHTIIMGISTPIPATNWEPSLTSTPTSCHNSMQNPNEPTPPPPPQRISRDHCVVDNYGRLLLQFCRNRDLTF